MEENKTITALQALSEQMGELMEQQMAIAVNTKEILNADEAARYLGMSIYGIYNLTHRRLLPYSKPSNKLIYFKRSDLEAWALGNRVMSADEANTEAAKYMVRSKKR